MKTRALRPQAAIIPALITLLAALTGLLLVPATGSAATNLVTNGTFETGSLTGWSCASGAVTGSARTGSHALEGTPTSSDNARCTQSIPVKPSTTYTLSAWVKGSNVYLGFEGGTSTWSTSTTWNQLTTTFTTSAATTRVTIYLHGWYGLPPYQADDVVLDGPRGTPDPTTPPPTTTPPPSGGALPKHVLTGYWQNFNNGATVQRISDVHAAYDLIAVAFADADPARPGGITFTLDSAGLGGYTVAQFKADIAAKQAAGKKVILSVGGQNGTISVGSAEAATNFATSALAVLREYGFDGIDIDLENGVNAQYMGQALRSLHSQFGSGLIIAMAPQTIDMQSTSFEYFKLALAIKDILTVVNVQYYNSGSMNGCDGQVYSQGTVDFITAQACIMLQNGLRPDQVGLGLPASSRAAGSGYVSPQIVNNALDCLTRGTNCGNFKPSTTWPSLRGAMTWSTNWDALNGSAFANQVGAHVHALP
jgi:chitinase